MIEDSIERRQIYYIPKSHVKAIASKIRNGDILGITTSLEGMDCSHTGIAIWKDGELRFMHAPVPGAKVQITSSRFGNIWKKIINRRESLS